MSIIDHANLPVSDLDRSRRFYEAALGALGYKFIGQDGQAVGFGIEDWNFGIVRTEESFPTMHFAFKAATPEQVNAFYKEALRAGGRSNGVPGIRPQYDLAYFAAFVLDPDGHNIEAVHRGR